MGSPQCPQCGSVTPRRRASRMWSSTLTRSVSTSGAVRIVSQVPQRHLKAGVSVAHFPFAPRGSTVSGRRMWNATSSIALRSRIMEPPPNAKMDRGGRGLPSGSTVRPHRIIRSLEELAASAG